MVEEFEIHLHDVVDEYEVATLLAGAVAAGRCEEAHLPLARILSAEWPDDRRHAALVLLARPVDVEVAKSRDLRRSIRQHSPHVLVEQEFRVAVDIETPLEFA